MLLVYTATGEQSLGLITLLSNMEDLEDPAEVELANLEDIHEVVGVFNKGSLRRWH